MFDTQDDLATVREPEHFYASAAAPAAAQPTITKSAGGSDSVKNSKSSQKAPGGKDAAKQKDGG